MPFVHKMWGKRFLVNLLLMCYLILFGEVRLLHIIFYQYLNLSKNCIVLLGKIPGFTASRMHG